MVNQFKNLLIGLFLIGSIALFVGLILFLRPSVGDEKQTLFIRFSNINKIGIGTRVLFAGKPIGEVTAIDQIYHARETQPTDPLGRLYFYQLTLKIDSGIKVYNTDEISLQTSGLLGEKSVAITPKAPPTGMTPQLLTSKTPYYADSVDPIENTFARLSDIGQKLEDTIDLVHDWLLKNRDPLSEAVASFGSALQQIDIAVREVNGSGLIKEAAQGVKEFTHLMANGNQAFATLNQGRAFEHIASITQRIDQASSSLNEIFSAIQSGKGTLGRLITQDDLYLQASAILSKADTMMNDINHYGILFHLNKGWQRMRTQRMNAVAALNSPDQFKDYFTKEIDEINTSMARLSSVIDKASLLPKEEKTWTNEAFKKDFAELLKQVSEMADTLKLYNEQISAGGAN